jgi:hypothetical protein
MAKAGQQARASRLQARVPKRLAPCAWSAAVTRNSDALNLECVDRGKNAGKSPPRSSPRRNAADALVGRPIAPPARLTL